MVGLSQILLWLDGKPDIEISAEDDDSAVLSVPSLGCETRMRSLEFVNLVILGGEWIDLGFVYISVESMNLIMVSRYYLDQVRYSIDPEPLVEFMHERSIYVPADKLEAVERVLIQGAEDRLGYRVTEE